MIEEQITKFINRVSSYKVRGFTLWGFSTCGGRNWGSAIMDSCHSFILKRNGSSWKVRFYNGISESYGSEWSLPEEIQNALNTKYEAPT